MKKGKLKNAPPPNTRWILVGPGPYQHYAFIKHFVLLKSINKMIIYANISLEKRKNKRQTALENKQLMAKVDESN